MLIYGLEMNVRNSAVVFFIVTFKTNESSDKPPLHFLTEEMISQVYTFL